MKTMRKCNDEIYQLAKDQALVKKLKKTKDLGLLENQRQNRESFWICELQTSRGNKQKDTLININLFFRFENSMADLSCLSRTKHF